jgi:EAL domain-containing protein (putative c-di-GMP-specific phosphodiesterase class I)
MMQEVEYQFWVREQERKLRGIAPKPILIKGEIPRFSMAFQPIVNVLEGTTFAFEALVRSESGENAQSVLSRVPPRNFHLFDKACRSRAMAEAMRSGLLLHPSQKLCVNVNPNAAVSVHSHLRLTCDEAVGIGFPLDRLVLELVEDDEICDFDGLKRIVDDYRSYGVKIAMDDFGAGYSGLKLLSKLQPDIVKLDMALISRLNEDRTSQVIVKAIVQACTELEIVTIAEGVETLETAMRLRDMGVVYQQGYYFAKPGFEFLPQVTFALPAWGTAIAVPQSIDGRSYAKKNSFVRSSFTVSRNLAAFSNSKFFAASRISLSRPAICLSSSCWFLKSAMVSSMVTST